MLNFNCFKAWLVGDKSCFFYKKNTISVTIQINLSLYLCPLSNPKPLVKFFSFLHFDPFFWGLKWGVVKRGPSKFRAKRYSGMCLNITPGMCTYL